MSRQCRFDLPALFLRRSMEVLHVKSIVCSLVVALASASAIADTAAFQRCRQITDAAARLACYDALDLAPVGAATSAQQTPAPATPESFGFEARQAAVLGPDAVESAIAGPFDGWVPRQRLRLANGQVWEISDGSQAAYRLQAPKVRIARGMSGTFFLAIEGVAQTPRVRRVE